MVFFHYLRDYQEQVFALFCAAKMVRKNLSDEELHKANGIIKKRCRLGWTKTKIIKRLKRKLNISRSVAYRLFQQFESTGDLKRKTKRGRKPKSFAEDEVHKHGRAGGIIESNESID